jgi:ATPase subunit of ABC transporter with duplicated ATPase domains
MPASVTLSRLSWSTPDGHALFTDLDLSFGPGLTGIVGRNGVGKSTLLSLISETLAPRAGTITVGGTLGVLRQQVQPAPGETIARLFGIEADLERLARAASGTASLADLAAADWTLDARLDAALAEFGLEASADTPLARLSGGQRTRAALAALVFRAPDILILDEPTNNLDADGREAVVNLLDRWRGTASTVSHDRALLERMDVIVELTSIGATRYGGNYSHYLAIKARELASAQHDVADAERRVIEAERAAQTAAERKARKDSAGRRHASRGDMPKILLGARKAQSEETGGGNRRVAERRIEAAEQDLTTARRRLEVIAPFRIELPTTGLAATRQVLRLDAVAAGHPDRAPVVDGLDFALTGPERVALTGENGSGKTTLLSTISGRIPAIRGTVIRFVETAMLDQTVSILDPALSIRDAFARLWPEAGENTCRAALARFRFRADAALQAVATLSGGELLRAGLACVLGGPRLPQLLILDEPTNHLDIESLATVEAGLRAYDGALLVVSHDRAFLDAIGITRTIRLPPDG